MQKSLRESIHLVGRHAVHLRSAIRPSRRVGRRRRRQRGPSCGAPELLVDQDVGKLPNIQRFDPQHDARAGSLRRGPPGISTHGLGRGSLWVRQLGLERRGGLEGREGGGLAGDRHRRGN